LKATYPVKDITAIALQNHFKRIMEDLEKEAAMLYQKRKRIYQDYRRYPVSLILFCCISQRKQMLKKRDTVKKKAEQVVKGTINKEELMKQDQLSNDSFKVSYRMNSTFIGKSTWLIPGGWNRLQLGQFKFNNFSRIASQEAATQVFQYSILLSNKYPQLVIRNQ